MSCQVYPGVSMPRRSQDGIIGGGQHRSTHDWQLFDNWFRAMYDRSGHRPKKAMIAGWYEQHAHLVWREEGERPSLQETRHHAKGLSRALLAGRDLGALRGHRYPLRSHRGSTSRRAAAAALGDSSGQNSSDGDGAGGSDSGRQPEHPHPQHTPPRVHAHGGATPPPQQPPMPPAAPQQQQQQHQEQQGQQVPGTATPRSTPAQQQRGTPIAAPAQGICLAQQQQAQQQQQQQQAGASGSSGSPPSAQQRGGGASGGCDGLEWCEYDEEPIGMDIFMINHSNP